MVKPKLLQSMDNRWCFTLLKQLFYFNSSAKEICCIIFFLQATSYCSFAHKKKKKTSSLCNTEKKGCCFEQEVWITMPFDCFYRDAAIMLSTRSMKPTYLQTAFWSKQYCILEQAYLKKNWFVSMGHGYEALGLYFQRIQMAKSIWVSHHFAVLNKTFFHRAVTKN